ncbi:MAG: O-antigen ligase family protein [Acidimicrobiales bacterium]
MRAVRAAARAVGLTTACAWGYGLAWAAGRFGGLAPLAMVGIVVVPAVLLAVAADARVGIGVVFLVFPFGFTQIPGTPLDVIQVVIVVVAVVVGLCRLADRAPLAWPAPLWWIIALLGWTIVSLPSAIDASPAVRQIGALAVELVFLIVILVACKGHDDVRRAITPLLAVAAVVAATTAGASKNVNASFGGSLVEGRARGVFTEPNQLGTICMLATLLALALAFGSAGRRSRALAGGAAVVVAIGLLLSLSRGSWIGFACGLAVLLVSLPMARRSLALVCIALLGLGVAVQSFAPSPPQVEVVGERLKSIVGEKNPYDDRPQIWAEARREIIERPVVGVGPGNFPIASQRATSESRTAFARHAHNFLLTWAAESGIPAALLLLGLSAHIAVLARRARRLAVGAGRYQDAALLAGLSAAAAAVLGQGLVDYTLRNSVVFTAVVGVFGFLLASIGFETSLAPAVDSPR